MKSPKELLKTIAFRHLPALSAPRYAYGLDPIELAFLVGAITDRATTSGCIVEIGVARGMTTRFLAEHLVRQGIRKEYHAIDTFSSFTKHDLAYETESRRKTPSDLAGFSYNDFDIWKRNFSGFDFIRAHKCDCKDFDFTTIKPVSVALLDVDLYLPTSRTLPKLYDALEPGGVILLDDVKAESAYDGARQAYVEFSKSLGLPQEIVGLKGGVFRRNS
jgi:hypothetical protein